MEEELWEKEKQKQAAILSSPVAAGPAATPASTPPAPQGCKAHESRTPEPPRRHAWHFSVQPGVDSDAAARTLPLWRQPHSTLLGQPPPTQHPADDSGSWGTADSQPPTSSTHPSCFPTAASSWQPTAAPFPFASTHIAPNCTSTPLPVNLPPQAPVVQHGMQLQTGTTVPSITALGPSTFGHQPMHSMVPMSAQLGPLPAAPPLTPALAAPALGPL